MTEWLIADTHFYHNKLSEYCGRPANFTDLIVENWKKLVNPEDTVYHLGDLGFHKKREVIDLCKELPGYKILILGNHDRFPLARYMAGGFMVMNYALVNIKHTEGIQNPRNHYYKVLLSHKPQWISSDSITVNVHGHFHNNKSKSWESELVNRLTLKHRLFSLEDQEYKPIKFSDALYHNLLPLTIQKLVEGFRDVV